MTDENKAVDALTKIANIAHHGGLLGFDGYTAMNEIRRLSLPYWDEHECTRLQLQRKPSLHPNA